MQYLGIDIGGTKVSVSVGTHEGEILASERFAMDHALAPEAVLEDALSRLAKLQARLAKLQETHATEAVSALGVSCPGPLGQATGSFLEPPNMPTWHHFGIRDWLEQRQELPVAIMNDANASVLAEAYWGAAKGKKTAVYLTMSTGMGAGLLIDGKVFEGPQGLAGEIGHLRLSEDGPVGFGKRGSVEGYLSGPGMVQVAHAERILCEQKGEATLLSAQDPITPESLFEATRAGDSAACRVTSLCARKLGQLLGMLTDILNPEVFILGTIGAAHPDLFIEEARQVLAAEALPKSVELVQITGSPLSNRGDLSAIACGRLSLEL